MKSRTDADDASRRILVGRAASAVALGLGLALASPLPARAEDVADVPYEETAGGGLSEVDERIPDDNEQTSENSTSESPVEEEPAPETSEEKLETESQTPEAPAVVTPEIVSQPQNVGGAGVFRVPAQVPAVDDVATIGDQGYTTLGAAITAANAAGGATTVKLVKGVALSEQLSITGNVTLDGGGNTISRGSGYTGGFFTVDKGAALSLVNIILDGGASEWGLDYENTTRSGTIIVVPFTGTESIADATAPLVTNNGTLATQNATLKDAYTSHASASAILSTEGSALALGAGTTVSHCAVNNNDVKSGAILAEAGSALSIAGTADAPVTFSGNAATGRGGALAIESYLGDGTEDKQDAKPSVSNAVFESNYSRDDGAGIYCERQAMDVSDSTFANNVTSNDGGAIMMTSWAAVGSDDPTENGNAARKAGLTDQESHFTNLTFTGNKAISTVGDPGKGAVNSVGGAIDVGWYFGAGMVFENCDFTENSAGSGGAIGSFILDKVKGETRDNAKMSFTGCTFANNKAAGVGDYYYTGGAIALDWFDITMTDCTLVGNSARRGGAVWLDDAATLTMDGCTLTDNSATSGGGAVMLEAKAALVMNACIATGNSAPYGGVLAAWDDGSATLNDCTITGNKAIRESSSGGLGAVAYLMENASLNVNGSTIKNGAAYQGAVAYLLDDAVATVANSTISDNEASNHGGVAYVSNRGSLTFSDSVASGNKAGGSGGFVHLRGTSGGNVALTLDSGAVVTGNSASTGGGAVEISWASNLASAPKVSFTMLPGSLLYGNAAGGYGDDIDVYSSKGYTASVTLVAGKDMGTAGARTSDGHVIDGWYLDQKERRYTRNASDEQTVLTLFASDISLKAEASTFYVCYEANAADATGEMDSQEVGFADYLDESLTLSPNAFKRTGWRFSSWNVSADGSGRSYADEATVLEAPEGTVRGGEVMLFAQWDGSYTVNFDGNARSSTGSTPSVTLAYDAPGALPVSGFSRPGFYFTGWNSAADGTGTSHQPGDVVTNLSDEADVDVTLYAQWVPYVVSYDANGGAGSMEVSTPDEANGLVTVSAGGFSREGYRFVGWNTEADGTGDVVATGELTEALTADLTLYAQWEKVEPVAPLTPGTPAAVEPKHMARASAPKHMARVTVPETGDSSSAAPAAGALGTLLATLGLSLRRRRVER